MTGFDSEADRRDAVRKQIVDAAVEQVHECIGRNRVTATPEERRYLELAVAMRLLDGLRLEAMSVMMRQEIATAEKAIEG